MSLKDETGVYVEVSRDKMKFVSKEAEIMFDLSMENDYLEKENKELKEKYLNAVADYETTMSENKQLSSNTLQLKNQQKEFIKYLEDEIFKNTPNARWKHYDDDGSCDYSIEECDCIKIQPVSKTLKEILQKYKEIIGDDYE